MEVHIEKRIECKDYGIWLMAPSRIGNYNVIAKPAELIFEDKGGDAMARPEPTLRLSYEYAQEFFQAMVNELSRVGLRPDNDKVSGLYEAQTVHLKDLQKINGHLLSNLGRPCAITND